MVCETLSSAACGVFGGLDGIQPCWPTSQGPCTPVYPPSAGEGTSGHSIWSHLPDQVLGLALQHLQPCELPAVRATCRMWKLFIDLNLMTLRPKPGLSSRIDELFPSLTRLDLTLINTNDRLMPDVIRSAANLSALKRLDLTCAAGSSFFSIPSGVTDLRSLRILVIGKANDFMITQESICIPEGFEALKELEELRFKGVAPDFRQLCRLQSLKFLRLGKRRLGDMYLEGVGLMTELRGLDLTGDPLLATIPTEISQLLGLRHLDLARNRLQALPNEIGYLTGLTALIANRNCMHHVSNSIGNLVNLAYLDLSNNSLRVLPSSLTSLVGLRTLDLSSNLLQSLPDDPGNLMGLITLRLDHNNITHLSPSIGQMDSLRYLSMSHNYLEKLPMEIGTMNALTHLSLSANHLTFIPETISGLTALRHMSLDQNCLEDLPQGICKCGNLATMDLSFNRLQDVPAPILGMKRYNEFYMEFNPFCDNIREVNDTGSGA